MPYGNKETIIECKIAAQASRLRLLRSIIQDALDSIGIDKVLCRNLILAINEACMNIIQHAYQYQQNKVIQLTIMRDEGGLTFILQDDAPCLDLSKIKSRDISLIRPGGLGVYFINKIMDEVRYEECKTQGNTLILFKKS
jgi:anti-sigma regulatory factor (Ser/Thr protein kinase)